MAPRNSVSKHSLHAAMPSPESSSASEPESSDDEQHQLSDKIADTFVDNEFEGRQVFIPEGSLDDILTPTTISDQLLSCIDGEKDEAPCDFDELVKFIRFRAKKLFAICVCAKIKGHDLFQAMMLFQKHGFTDDRLPVKPFPRKGKAKARDHELGMLDKHIWDKETIRDFCERQWRFLAPVFEIATGSHSPPKDWHDFQHYHILPFIKKFNEGSANGSFGRVYKCEIHPNHISPNPPWQGWTGFVAVKEIRPRDDDDRQKIVINWGREAKVLREMNMLNQPHIVRFITAFRLGETGNEDHYLIFEWADGGNLRDLWKNLKRPESPEVLVKATVDQILGLAHALYNAHYPKLGPGTHFRHGDLKPENILWFRDEGDDSIGMLKIGDWGLAKEHNMVTELRSNRSTTSFGTRRYEPPEVVTGLKVGLDPHRPGKQLEKRRSRLYDIWAMGCITLEFIIWLLYDTDGLNQFNQELESTVSDIHICSFYQIEEQRGKKVARVHDVAVKWMNWMSKDPACQVGQTALGDLLEFVQNNLLVVRLPARGATLSQSESDLRFFNASRRSSISTITSVIDGPAITISPPVDMETQPGTVLQVPGIVVSDTEPEGLLSPPPTPPTPTLGDRDERATAREFVHMMEQINSEQEPEYWFVDAPERSPPPVVSLLPRGYQTRGGSSGQSTVPSDGEPMQTLDAGALLSPLPTRSIDYGNTRLEDDWDTIVDNEYAKRLFLGAQKHSAPSSVRDEVTTAQVPIFQLDGQTMSTNKLMMDSPRSLPIASIGYSASVRESSTTSNNSHAFSNLLANASSTLCGICRSFCDEIWSPGFSKTYLTSHLERHAKGKLCDLCGLLWKTCQQEELTGNATARFERIGSALKLNGMESPVLSIFRSPELQTRIDNDIQIGFAMLPEAGTDDYFAIIKHWLDHCDDTHTLTTCPPVRYRPEGTTGTVTRIGKRLPSRVIDVGHKNDLTVRLRQTSSRDTGEWLALSHQWGSGEHCKTTVSNLQAHLNGIQVADLPATFRDAVTVTRHLGLQYLWIDSLCIVQGPGGDFSEEAKRMEHVYSGAHCVLAASRGVGHAAGFLNPRIKRDYVALCQDGATAPFYLTENIDDFNVHVLEGALNQRGWVFQEHALARRTIFFTDHQMYFECGAGVRCETMTLMKNNLAAFLGDPSFPQVLWSSKQGEKIQGLQDLYRRYSRLGLTNDFDRPLAIDSLQTRILEALSMSGGFGVFDEGPKKKGMLRRSLLWIRGADTPSLNRIVFPSGRGISAVPSWSWMAYTGGIDYIRAAFGRVDWEDLQSPWFPSESGQPSNSNEMVVHSEGQGDNISLIARARHFDASLLLRGRPDEGKLVWDTLVQSEQQTEKLMCVVLGRLKEPAFSSSATVRPTPPRGQLTHYLLIIRETRARDRNGNRIYERVGAGHLPGRCILEEGPIVTIH